MLNEKGKNILREISFETAKLAAEKGFNEDSVSYYTTKGELSVSISIIGIEPKFKCWAPYQAELQEWLRNEHGVSVLVELDETLSYIWIITGLYPKASIQEFHVSNEVWCGHYEDCLEDGLQTALRLM